MKSKPNSREEIALAFVNLLVPGCFHLAEEFLSKNCTYKYGNSLLTDEAIIRSFIQSHEKAQKKLDEVRYPPSEIEKLEDCKVFILVRDQVFMNGKSHLYTDRLIITVPDLNVKRPITFIENVRVDGEREKLMQFFDSCGVVW